MRKKIYLIIVISFSLFLTSSCSDSSVGPDMMNITGIYSYKTVDSSGSILDSGILILTQIDSTLTGEIHTQTGSAKLSGQIKYSGSLIFTENPEKLYSFYWWGVWENDTIQGYVGISASPPIPVHIQKFIAVHLPIY